MMATITVRDLEDGTRERLRVRAARNGRSMEAEARQILTAAVASEPADTAGVGSRIRSLFADVGYADDLADLLPERSAPADRVDFDR
ncbi:Arc family DNA-binding protein [Herbiconiux sp. VKM Ac-2851]|jgi:plasmid stability protein|uniref:FitA-like ribbon-helix-helix domain-containing protein n=1 Tax=Herbiconiux sp. VKM Ac-2851 TaxID=2739025 RepID=UPI001C208E56|nr:Arc family DNA-binding protein [Herbiconiux sp. VKM Ac-2851]